MENVLYIILAIAGLFLFMQIYMRLTAYLKKGKKIQGVGGSLGKEIERGKKVLVYFYTNSCAACKPMTPVVDRLKESYKNIHKVNLASEMDTGRSFGVMGTPALVLVEDSKIQSYNLGARNEHFIKNLLD